jgi:citrate lyase beta subunit
MAVSQSNVLLKSFQPDGKMLDKPHLVQALRLLASANQNTAQVNSL